MAQFESKRRLPQKNHSLGIVFVFGPLVVLGLLLVVFHREILFYFFHPQQVSFGSQSVEIRNLSSSGWTEGTATLNGTYRISLPPISAHSSTEIQYIDFKDGEKAFDPARHAVLQIHLAPGGTKEVTHVVPRSWQKKP